MIGNHLRLAVRVLLRTPAFTVPALASLALGIALNTTMFSVVNAVLLRPLASWGPEGLVRIGRSMNDDGSFRSVSHDELDFLRRHATAFSDLVGAELGSLSLGGSAGPQFVSAEIVTSNYFRALRAAPVVGRGFEEQATDDRSVVISERFWLRHFGAEPAILGRGVTINNQPFTVVGVAPPGFDGMFPGVAIDVWLPSTRRDATDRTDPRAIRSMDVLGILNNGVSVASARSELQVLSHRLSDMRPEHDRARGLVMAEARGIHPALGRRVGPFALAMLAVVGLVLLIVCANVASLLLARTSARRGELAVRLALGAARRRVAMQLLTESFVLALVGGAGGFALSYWAVGAINALTLAAGPTGAPVFLDLQLDRRVLAFTLAASLLTAIACGLLPAMLGTRLNLTSVLKDPQSSPDRRRARVRGTLVVLQVTVTVVLMIGTVLLFRSLRNGAHVDLGFDPDRVAVVSFNLQPLGYDRTRTEQFYRELLERVRGLPRVDRAALARFIPMAGGHPMTVMNPPSTTAPGLDQVSAAYNLVSDDYFETMGQPVLRGRGFTAQDRAGLPPVAIVNEAMARRLWPGEPATGRRLLIAGEPGDPGVLREVVGVATDARFASFGGEIGPCVFVPAPEGFGQLQTLHIRSSDPEDVLSEIHDVVRQIDANVIPRGSRTLRVEMSSALLPARIVQTVLGVAGAIALLLAIGGLYGLVCYTLQQRVKEIAIRVALGATQGKVFGLIVGGTVRLAAVGLGLGLALAAMTTRLISSLLVDVSPVDPLTFAGVAIVIAAATLGAAHAAARKGLHVDSVAVLKYE